MIRALLACAKSDFGDRLDTALAEATELLGPKGVNVLPASGINWDQVRLSERGWAGAYRWAARAHDALIVLETLSGCLSRGVYEMADEFMRLSKPVGALRDSKVVKVTSLRLTGDDDWRDRYGVAVVVSGT